MFIHLKVGAIFENDSAFRQHLLQNSSCASQYSDAKFSILARERTSFHQSNFEATVIKSFQSDLCRHKEFFYSIKNSFTNALFRSHLIGRFF